MVTTETTDKEAQESKPLIQNAEDAVRIFSQLTRAGVISRLGKSFGEGRDVYDSLGYKKKLEFDDYLKKYLRQDLAKAIIDRPVNKSWSHLPTIRDAGNGKNKSPFEQGWIDIEKRAKIFHYIARADRLARIGNYSILLLGFNDVTSPDAPGAVKLSDPVENPKDLIFIRPYSQKNAQVKDYYTDPSNPKFEMPKTYQVATAAHRDDGVSETQTATKVVHESRIVHIAEDRLESEILGIPVLEASYNRFDNLELVVGGQSEAYWQLAFAGMAFLLDEDTNLSPDAKEDFEDEIQMFIHGFRRHMKLKNMKVQEFQQQIGKPKETFDMLVNLIAGTHGFPNRMLTGTERGELASSQDRKEWNEKIEDRNINFCEPTILRQIIDRLVQYKILPAPTGGEYEVEWQDLNARSDNEKADLVNKMMDGLKKWIDSGGEEFIPLSALAERWGVTPEELEAWVKEVKETTDADANGTEEETEPEQDDDDIDENDD